ncbi:hypothetical protein D3C72_2399660 [compost metagenome]
MQSCHTKVAAKVVRHGHHAVSEIERRRVGPGLRGRHERVGLIQGRRILPAEHVVRAPAPTSLQFQHGDLDGKRAGQGLVRGSLQLG